MDSTHRTANLSQGIWSVDYLIVVLALLGPALGGATELWTQALLVAGAATIMLWRPPHFPISRPLLMLFFILMALACLGFLPAAWFRTIPFRTNLVQIQQTTLPGTLSMQPWQTLEGALLLAATLTWTGFLLAHAWSAHRRSLLAFYAAGLVAMTILAFFSILPVQTDRSGVRSMARLAFSRTARRQAWSWPRAAWHVWRWPSVN
ncbi:MAG: hypothetical protein U1G07_16380 [Verrucomicrobiota bacterium]